MTKYIIIKNSEGFSLLELAVVLFILAIVLTGLLVPLAERQEGQKRQDTEYHLEQIRDAIIGYTVINGRLPCPDCACSDPHNPNCGSSNYCSDFGIAAADTNDGVEDRISGYCPGDDSDSNTGNIPWVTLGIRKSDAWGNNYTYKITSTYADSPPANTGGCYSPDMSFNLCDTGGLEIDSDDSGTALADGVVAIIVSHGGNYDADDPSSLETENLNGDELYIDSDYSRAEDAEFDDLVYWISPHTLRIKMVDAGRLP